MALALLNVKAGNAMSNIIQKAVIDKSGIPLYKQFLNLSSLRQKLIAGNLSNVSTPKYQSKDIDFHAELKKAIGGDNHIQAKLTHPAHIPVGRTRDSEPEIIVDKSAESNGVNNVDVDKEVANLAMNQITFTVGAKLMAKKFAGLSNAIKSK